MSFALRILVVEDERPARERLCELAAGLPDAELAGSCEDGPQALEYLRNQDARVDLALLDIALPGLSGIEVMRRLEPERRPAVVFVTAYDRYALEAFDLEAAHYLMKPFDRARLAEAVERVRRLRAPWGPRLTNRAPRTPSLDERFVLRCGARRVLVRPAEIDWIESAGNYLHVWIAGTSHLARSTLRRMEQRLAPLGFLRVRRSVLVNGARIRELVPSPGGELHALLEDGRTVRVGRTYRASVRRFLRSFRT